MLELRPTCEHCRKSLPPNSTEAMICTYECTFCRDCVNNVLENVCPNCGGGFAPRPIRPRANLRDNNYLGKNPATEKITYNPVDIEKHRAFAKAIKSIPPEDR
ncbi:MAG TPA: DUF1272 domain-containing protein [Gammaproteobacteria bacterium]|nr:DUF1272 domain-containing protein [Gammaproteobacteria bacterium]